MAVLTLLTSRCPASTTIRVRVRIGHLTVPSARPRLKCRRTCTH
ncbi:hypothetical protein L917_05223 [Phytophthora nicotianae]|uniref:Uncharacterized protein n=1 Tax=Phytophthora nicotianae TaxID=4792 RepID=W2LJ90_PHYNI|nr:hypothetical protein L915_05385 [Phytophthora nicotianae]ETL97517.1 hypothetical protein L917_05223 [Phytophthora nicotianae]